MKRLIIFILAILLVGMVSGAYDIDESLEFQENASVKGAKWVNATDFNGSRATFINVTAENYIGNLTGNSNSSTFWAGVSSYFSRWFYKVGASLRFNETRMNDTIDYKNNLQNNSLKGYSDANDTSIKSTISSNNASVYSWVDSEQDFQNISLKGYSDENDSVLRSTILASNSSTYSYIDSQDSGYNISTYSWMDYEQNSQNDSLKGYSDTNDTSIKATITANNASIYSWVDSEQTAQNNSLKGYMDDTQTAQNTSLIGYSDENDSMLRQTLDSLGNFSSGDGMGVYFDNLTISMGDIDPTTMAATCPTGQVVINISNGTSLCIAVPSYNSETGRYEAEYGIDHLNATEDLCTDNYSCLKALPQTNFWKHILNYSTDNNEWYYLPNASDDNISTGAYMRPGVANKYLRSNYTIGRMKENVYWNAIFEIMSGGSQNLGLSCYNYSSGTYHQLYYRSCGTQFGSYNIKLSIPDVCLSGDMLKTQVISCGGATYFYEGFIHSTLRPDTTGHGDYVFSESPTLNDPHFTNYDNNDSLKGYSDANDTLLKTSIDSLGNWSSDLGDYYTSSQIDTQRSNNNASLKGYSDQNDSLIWSWMQSIGNWTLDKSSYYLSSQVDTIISSIGNWTQDKGDYNTATQTDTLISGNVTNLQTDIDSRGNWTEDQNITIIYNFTSGEYELKHDIDANGKTITDVSIYETDRFVDARKFGVIGSDGENDCDAMNNTEVYAQQNNISEIKLPDGTINLTGCSWMLYQSSPAVPRYYHGTTARKYNASKTLQYGTLLYKEDNGTIIRINQNSSGTGYNKLAGQIHMSDIGFKAPQGSNVTAISMYWVQNGVFERLTFDEVYTGIDGYGKGLISTYNGENYNMMSSFRDLSFEGYYTNGYAGIILRNGETLDFTRVNIFANFTYGVWASLLKTSSFNDITLNNAETAYRLASCDALTFEGIHSENTKDYVFNAYNSKGIEIGGIFVLQQNKTSSRNISVFRSTYNSSLNVGPGKIYLYNNESRDYEIVQGSSINARGLEYYDKRTELERDYNKSESGTRNLFIELETTLTQDSELAKPSNQGLLLELNFNQENQLDDKILDSSGYNHHAYIPYGNGFTYENGISGLALTSDGGGNSYLIVNDTNSLEVSDEATWEFWGNRDTYNANRAIMDKHDYLTNKRQFRIRDVNTDELELGISSNGIDSNDSTSRNNCGLTNNVWSYHSIVFDSGNIYWYKNGELCDNQSVQTTSIHDGTDLDLWILRAHAGAVTWVGSIDGMKMYNRSLSESEIKNNYDTISEGKLSSVSQKDILVDYKGYPHFGNITMEATDSPGTFGCCSMNSSFQISCRSGAC